MTREEQWLKFLSRWCLITAALGVCLVALFFIAVALDVPMDQGELIGAVRKPWAHRLQASFDSAVWIGIGGVLLAFAGVIRARAPLRSTLVAACGIGQLVGCAGGFIRFTVVDDLAARYAHAGVVEQAQLMQTYRDQSDVFGSFFGEGALLYGLGLLLIATVLYSGAELPRWLAIWIGLSGAYPIIQRLLAIAGVDLRSAFVVYFLLGQIALYTAIGFVLLTRLRIARSRPEQPEH